MIRRKIIFPVKNGIVKIHTEPQNGTAIHYRHPIHRIRNNSELPVQRMNDSSITSIPSVDYLLNQEKCSELQKVYGRHLVTQVIRQQLSLIRKDFLDKELSRIPSTREIVETIETTINHLQNQSLKPVLNLTGTLIHTNLGRSPLAQEAINALVLAASMPSNLEYNLGNHSRGDRDSHIESLITQLTGAEAALVVNNNAAALLLALNTVSFGKEVIVSRGELVEIGGSFRIPDILRSAGAVIKEVGTTNRTHLTDYIKEISDNTAAILKVHTSNYRIEGFTQSVPEQELSSAGIERGIPVIMDLGSGTLIDFSEFGLPHEPTVKDSINHKVDLVTFSGDKLLGGPQAGIIAGRKSLIDNMKENPLRRTLRVDKLTIAALSETLKLYLTPEKLINNLPLLNIINKPVDKIRLMAEEIVKFFGEAIGDDFRIYTEALKCQIGSGSFPMNLIDSYGLVIEPSTFKDSKAGKKKLAELFDQLHHLPIPVIGRISNGKLILDLRTLDTAEALIHQLDYLLRTRR